MASVESSCLVVTHRGLGFFLSADRIQYDLQFSPPASHLLGCCTSSVQADINSEFVAPGFHVKRKGFLHFFSCWGNFNFLVCLFLKRHSQGMSFLFYTVMIYIHKVIKIHLLFIPSTFCYLILRLPIAIPSLVIGEGLMNGIIEKHLCFFFLPLLLHWKRDSYREMVLVESYFLLATTFLQYISISKAMAPSVAKKLLTNFCCTTTHSCK